MVINLTTEESMVDLVVSVTRSRYKRWEAMSNILGLSIYEYIRRCTDAHTHILETDSFDFVADYNQYHHPENPIV